ARSIRTTIFFKSPSRPACRVSRWCWRSACCCCSLPALSVSASSFWHFSWRAALPINWRYPSPRLLRRCALAAFAALGLAYATTSPIGEYRYALGFSGSLPHDKAVAQLTHAARIFPLAPHIRRGEVDYYALKRWEGARPAAIVALRAALAADPFAADL